MALSHLKLENFTSSALDHKVAIIDIGSNSVRLVVYDALKRAPLPLYNEKVLCRLGQGLEATGYLNPEGVVMAEACIARFIAMCRITDIMETHILATAAVRDASDGKAFVDALEHRHNVKISVISGEHEARLAALGILCSVASPDGIAGDLGGGSMELVDIENGKLEKQVTLPIGPLRILDATDGKKDKMRKLVEAAFANHGWLKAKKTPAFYAIGGSFRALAKIHMNTRGYPLKVLHQYTIDSAEALEFLEGIINEPLARLDLKASGTGKRARELVPAAITLRTLLERIHAQDVVFSGCGIREGFLFERLSPKVRKEDVLLAYCTDLAAQNDRAPAYARDLFNWMSPLVTGESAPMRRLREAFCLLSEIGWRIHPEYRAEWAYHRVIQSSMMGITHEQRVCLALALYHRYQFRMKHDWKTLTLSTAPYRRWAKLVGTAANLAYHLSGGMPGNLEHTPLKRRGSEVQLVLDEKAHALDGEAIKKRIDGLSEAFKAFSSKAK